MNHAQLRAFHAVAKNGGFSAAAKELGLTQPAITLQVQALEQNYNAKLFVRRGRRTEITSSGEMLLNLSKRIFTLEAEAHTLLSAIESNETGKLRIGGSSALSIFPILSRFQCELPKVNLSYSSLDPAEILERLLDYRVDVVLYEARISDKRIFSAKLYEDELKLAVAHTDEWQLRKSVSLNELHNRKIILPFKKENRDPAVSNWLKHAAFKDATFIELESKELALQAVLNGMGVGFFTDRETSGDDRVRLIDVDGFRHKSAVYVSCLAERKHSHLVSAFYKTALAGPKDIVET
jgi:DNA-binding transcriptional LysR family regulator